MARKSLTVLSLLLTTRETGRDQLRTKEVSNLREAPSGHTKEGWSSIRYICEAASAFSTMSKGSLIKGRNGKERNKVLAVFQKRVLAPHTIPSFSLLGISALERAPTAAAGLDGG